MSEETASAGHNSLTQSAREKLKQLVTKIERLEEEKAGVAADVKDTYGEAKALGYDTKALRAVIRRRRLDRQERAELDEIMDLYEQALGET